MLEAARRADSLTGPTWILARQQTAARGRRGRAWAQGQGNFAATLVMHTEPQRAALHSFVAALALYDALSALGADRLALKWPNDVLLGGGKVAGILLEMLPRQVLAVGIGVNLAHAPEAHEVEPGATPPVTLGIPTDPVTLLDQLDPAFDHWAGRLAQDGFAPVRDAWLARAARLGEVIRARTVTEDHTGTFETVDNDGCLVLSTAKARLRIPAAEVYF